MTPTAAEWRAVELAELLAVGRASAEDRRFRGEVRLFCDECGASVTVEVEEDDAVSAMALLSCLACKAAMLTIAVTVAGRCIRNPA
jgi:hypothetical protein